MNKNPLHFRSVTAQFGTLLLLTGCALPGGIAAYAGQSKAKADGPKAKTGKSAPVPEKAGPSVPVTTPVKLAYQYKTGDTRAYHVNGIFSGHFPPFATAGGAPIHLQAVLDYVTTVKKADEKGAVIDFKVAKGEVNILEEEPGPDGKIDPDKVAPFPLPLEQIQKTFDVTATILPDGKVTDIKGGDTSTIRLDLGIDLRKLFLVTAPMIFADKPVTANELWDFDDGLLGHRPGKVTYQGRLLSASTQGKNFVAQVGQRGESLVDSKLDKEGNSTDKADAAVGSLKGKVTLTGNVKFVAPVAAGDAARAGRVTEGRLEMNAALTRLLPDPDKKQNLVQTDIDIKARLFVSAGEAPSKTGTKTAAVNGK